MNTLDMKTPDLAEGNIDKIAALFPEVITEKEREDGTPTRSIDFDLLRQALSDSLVDGADERYRLDWPGKKRALLKANTPITKTLRPVREESVDFDTTQNLFIEGDNFEALKILQESYLGKVKMIYIDPPYNTGKDFVYSDKHTMEEEEYTELTGAEDEEGNKLFRENTRTNPRFHSDWLSMMYERLIIARDLLKDDGVIFISIDDNEVYNLRKVCDEIFGENNFVSQLIHQRAKGGGQAKYVVKGHDYILTYAKHLSDEFSLKREKVVQQKIVEVDGVKYIKDDDVVRKKFGKYDKSLGDRRCFYEELEEYKGPEKKKEIDYKIKSGELILEKNDSGMHAICKFTKLDEATSKLYSIIKVLSEEGKKDLESLGLSVFDYPKPVELIKILVQAGVFVSDKDDIVLDFFAGSGTTAHAVMSLNAIDDGNRRFIMVQIPEELEEEKGATKETKEAIREAISLLQSLGKPCNIAEISKERIRRAAKKIREDYADKIAERPEDKPLDTGFRTYRVDETNMKDVYYHPTELRQESLLDLADNIKEGRASEDLLTQVMLDLGLTLDLPLEERDMNGNKVFVVAGNALVACFDQALNDGVVDEIAELEPLKLVVRDATFGTGTDRDQMRTNLATRMKRLSPDTEITVL